MKSVILLTVFLTAFAASSEAIISFKIGPGLNYFNDPRLSGLNTRFQFLYSLDNFNAGYSFERSDLTASDAQNSANNFPLSSSINSLVIEKEIAMVDRSLPVFIGIEVGAAQITALAGTVAPPAGMTQTVPFAGIHGGIRHSNAGAGRSSFFFVDMGFRFIDIRDTVIPAGFTAGGSNFIDLNSLLLEMGFGVAF